MEFGKTRSRPLTEYFRGHFFLSPSPTSDCVTIGKSYPRHPERSRRICFSPVPVSTRHCVPKPKKSKADSSSLRASQNDIATQSPKWQRVGGTRTLNPVRLRFGAF